MPSLKHLHHQLTPAIAGLCAGLIGLVISLMLARLDIARERASAESRVLARMALVQSQLSTVLRSTFSPTDSLVHLIASQSGISQATFAAVGERLIAQTPTIRNLVIAPDDEIKQIYPLAGNEAAMGLRYASIPTQYATVLKAREKKSPVMAGPVALVQGGYGFIQRYPVFVKNQAPGDDRYWGVISIVADVDRVLEAGGVKMADELNLSIIADNGTTVFGNKNLSSISPVSLKMTIPGGEWELRAAPRAGWPSDSLWSSNYLLFGLINSLLLGWLGWLLLQRQQALKAQYSTLIATLAAKQHSEAALAREEARFEEAFASSPDPSWMLSGGRFIACNPAAVSELRYADPAELINSNPALISPALQPDGEASDHKAERMIQLAQERGLHRFEWALCRRDGTLFSAEVTLSRMTFRGNPVLYATWRDISAHKAAQAAAEESQRLLQAIVNSASTLIYVFDPAGRLLFCNQQFEKAVNRSREQIIGHLRSDFLPAAIAAQHLSNDQAVLASGKPLSIEETNLENDGEHTYLTLKSALYDSAGKAISVVGISTDITSRKQAEKDLQLASTIFANTADGILITDPSGTIVLTNPAFSQITGYSPGEALGANPRMLQSDRQDAEFYQQMWQTLRGSGIWQGEIWNRRKNGELYPEWLTITAVLNPQGVVSNYVGVFSDISAIKRSQADLQRLAHFDPLTDLPNRALFHDRLTHAIERAGRYKHHVAVMLLDLDGFKTVNDSLGHPIGDLLLQQVAHRLKHCVRVEDTVARLGGDEFAVVIANLETSENIIDVAGKMLSTIDRPFLIEDHSALVTTSIGIAVFPEDGQTPDLLIRNADAAMYQSKAAGRNTYHYYQPEMTEAAQRRLASEQALRRAIAGQEFEVWYQPQVCLASGKLLGAEALVRWRDPTRGLIPPVDFIPLAESTGLIIPVGEQVLRQVCRHATEWRGKGLNPGRLGVNVAGPQLFRSDFVGLLRTVLDQYALPPTALEIEITETCVLDNPDQARQLLDTLQGMGVMIAIDDFGTGYSSLSHLKKLPIDTLKIDRSFVSDLPDDPHDVAITRAILAMGRSLGFHVIAEGVETAGQHQFLLDEGCLKGQGYLFAKPMPVAQFTDWLSTRQPTAQESPQPGSGPL